MSVSSLRLRLLLLAALSIAVTLALGGVSLSLIFERHVERRVEDELRVRWDELAAALTVNPQGEPQLARSLSDPRYQRPLSGAYWQIADSSGPRLRSRSLWDETLPLDLNRVATTLDAVIRKGPNNSQLYVIERDVVRGGGSAQKQYWLAVALDHAEINALRDSFVSDTAIALTVLGAILLIGAAAQAAIGLKPLQLLRKQLAEIHTGRSARLSGHFPNEVAPLASSLNLLLKQQEQQITKARERAGDLAHGLKTPLTILAVEARRLEESGERESATVLREQVAFMRVHVERELARARTRGASAARGMATEAAQTANKLADLLKRVGKGAELDWVVAVPPELRVRMDPHDFGEVLGNLLDNARKWARSRVTILASPAPKGFVISVHDDGPGIPDAQWSRLVERGERGSPDVEGSGLGLAIVKSVLESYGLELILKATQDGGCTAAFEIEGWLEIAPVGSVIGANKDSGGGSTVPRSKQWTLVNKVRSDQTSHACRQLDPAP